MDRRQLIKCVIGTAVATAIPTMPFRWEEKKLTEDELRRILAEAWADSGSPDIVYIGPSAVKMIWGTDYGAEAISWWKLPR